MNYKKLRLLIAITALSYQVIAQLSLPPNGGNQKSIVRQYIGPVAYVEIVYNSPDVDGREGNIWGDVVKYGKFNQGFGKSTKENPSPWRAGANENTTIEFSHNMLLEGQEVEAGKYSLFMIVNELGSWKIILNQETRSWGSYFYEPELDVLSIDVSPEESSFHEFLTYRFVERGQNEATVALFWENKSLPLKISVPKNKEYVLNQLESELKSFQTFQSRNWSKAAEWASQNGFHEKALEWVTISIEDPSVGEKNYRNTFAKVKILIEKGDKTQAYSLANQCIHEPFIDAYQAYSYADLLVAKGMNEKAGQLFQFNYRRFNKTWPTTYGMARMYSSKGAFQKAEMYLELSKENVPNQDQSILDFIDEMLLKARSKVDFNQ